MEGKEKKQRVAEVWYFTGMHGNCIQILNLQLFKIVERTMTYANLKINENNRFKVGISLLHIRMEYTLKCLLKMQILLFPY